MISKVFHLRDCWEILSIFGCSVVSQRFHLCGKGTVVTYMYKIKRCKLFVNFSLPSAVQVTFCQGGICTVCGRKALPWLFKPITIYPLEPLPLWTTSHQAYYRPYPPADLPNARTTTHPHVNHQDFYSPEPLHHLQPLNNKTRIPTH